MLYMSSQSGNDGTYSLTVTFDVGTDMNTAVVMVQNRVALAMPLLPTQVQNQGITIRKRTPDILMVVNLFSPDGRYNDIYLSNYATIYVRDELLRVPGISDVTYMGERDYSIRALARSAKDGRLQHHRHGRGQRDPEPEPGRAGRPRRATPVPAPAGLRLAARHAGPADHAGAIRRHHRQGRPGRAAGAHDRGGGGGAERLGHAESRISRQRHNDVDRR